MIDKDVLTLVRYRLNQAQAAIEDAGLLLESKRPPFGIVNRAYYAMFYAVLALLQINNLVSKKHGGVLTLFDTEFVMKGIFPKEMSRDIHNAFDLRQASDYQIIESVTENEERPDQFVRLRRMV
jgi:uncharacterized protein (UPF0332 family)